MNANVAPVCSRGELERLEWSSTLELVAEFARTPMGRARVASMLPLSELAQIERRHERVAELRFAALEAGRLPISAVESPADSLTLLRVAGRLLTGRDVYELVRLLVVTRDVARHLDRLDSERHPELNAFASEIPTLDAVIDVIDGNLTPTGSFEDHASPELARIRGESRHLAERLQSIIGDLFKEKWTEPVIRDQYVTKRNNRYVIPIRTDTPRRFPGIVHGSSGTERTLFVEPLETVEVNNQLVRLAEAEEVEIERLLRAYTELLRAHREDVERTAELLARIDALESVATWSDASDAVRPEFSNSGSTKLVGARHPILERSFATHVRHDVVPLDIDLAREWMALVISGPNAGGKTVALKTIGLLTLLAHAGIPVPARQARIPYCRRVLVDIGDEQSIDDGLSTFSAHVQSLAEMVREGEPPALALIDEIGTGTDPAEGAALGIAVMSRLMQRGIHVVATTHHQAVKTWAYRTEGSLNAAAEFDEKTLRPTYRLVQGVAGASIGLTMAEQLGMDSEVVSAARDLLDPAGAEAARALESVRKLASELEGDRRELVEKRREAEQRLEARERALESRERDREEKYQRKLDRLRSEFRDKAEAMISRLGEAKDRRALDRLRIKQERELQREFKEPTPQNVAAAPQDWSPQPGESISVVSLGKSGVVKSIQGDRAQIALGRATFTVPTADLRPAEKPGSDAPDLPAGVSLTRTARDVPAALHVAGMRGEEACRVIDRYLDDAAIAGRTRVSIVHGVGSGRLRYAVREFLDSLTERAAWREAELDEGGAGTTIVELA